MAGDHLCATADDDLMDIAADLNLVMGIGYRHGIIVVAVPDHGDRRRPRAHLLAGIVRRGRQRHQCIQVAHQAVADRLGMATDGIVLALKALFFEPGVQLIETAEPGRRYEKIPPPIADHTLDVALVVPLSRPAKLVIEQVM